MKKYGNGGRTIVGSWAAEKNDGSGYARNALSELLEKGAGSYRRDRHLPGLIPCWPEQILDAGPGGTTEIIERLRRILRAERVRGKAGHWSYDLNRHISLAIALKAESARLAEMTENGRRPDPKGPLRRCVNEGKTVQSGERRNRSRIRRLNRRRARIKQ